MHVALIQLRVSLDPEDNFKRALAYLAKAAESGASVAILPEMFVCPYTHEAFKAHAQSVDDPWVKALCALSQSFDMLIVAGSMPLKEADRLYNSSLAIRQGQILARHDKVYLFDIDLAEGPRFFESETFTPGDGFVTCVHEGHTIGLAICYDLRFPEAFRSLVDQGAELCIVPAAFNMTTGPAHWELLARSRAVDNQCHMVLVSPAQDASAAYVAYGHSMAVDPWGRVLCDLGEAEQMMIVDLDFEAQEQIREQMPLLKHRKMRADRILG